MRPTLVWVVVEVHCSLKPAGQVSVWLSGRPLSDDKTLEEDVAVRLVGPVPGAEGERVADVAVRLVGPVPGAEGERVAAVLEEQLRAAGVTVIRSAAADD